MYFKKIFYIVLLVFFVGNIFATNLDEVQVYELANTQYQEEKYDDAIENYQSLISSGFETENVYFNLANSYAKANSIGKSILYYEKVLKLNPKNKDAESNLGFVKSLLKNDLNELPPLFFVTWYKNLVYYFDADTWAKIAIAFAWFFTIAIAFYLFSKNMFIKKASFAKAILFLIIAVFSYYFVNVTNGNIGKKTEIILIQEKSISKKAPSKNAEDAVTFFEGSKFIVLDLVEDFYKIKTSDGLVIWLNKEDFEII